MTTTSTARANRYAGKCHRCDGWIPAEAGLLSKVGGTWVAEHRGTCPAPTARPANAVPGYYAHDGKIIVVIQSKQHADRTYAKVLTGSFTASGRTKWSWEYARGVGYQVADLSPVSLADAAAWGVMHGTCLVCCRRLTDPESVTRGIGPVCAKRFR